MLAMWAVWAFKTWIFITSFLCIFAASSSSIHFIQKLKRKEHWSWATEEISLPSVDKKGKPKPVIRLTSHTKSFPNDPGTSQYGATQCYQNRTVLLLVKDTKKPCATLYTRNSVPAPNHGELPTLGGTCPAGQGRWTTNQL